jgi:hypothetical protein
MRGLNDLLRWKISSLFLLLGWRSISITSLMIHSKYLFFVAKMQLLWMLMCSMQCLNLIIMPGHGWLIRFINPTCVQEQCMELWGAQCNNICKTYNTQMFESIWRYWSFSLISTERTACEVNNLEHILYDSRTTGSTGFLGLKWPMTGEISYTFSSRAGPPTWCCVRIA